MKTKTTFQTILIALAVSSCVAFTGSPLINRALKACQPTHEVPYCLLFSCMADLTLPFALSVARPFSENFLEHEHPERLGRQFDWKEDVSSSLCNGR